MADTLKLNREDGGCFGRRMTAEEFLALPESTERYELIDGVVIMSPSASFWHQRIVTEIVRQISAYLESHPIGVVVTDVDVRIAEDVVYRPDILFLTNSKAERVTTAVTETPDLLVEIVSPSSRALDVQTKRGDYEAAGVREYWVIDPRKNALVFLVLESGRYRETSAAGESYTSAVLPGFKPDLARLRQLF